MQASASAEVPESFSQYVKSISYWHSGATLELTRAGIDLGRQAAGAGSLARMMIEQPGWQGRRTEQDVASEIKAHCVAWIWIPPLRGHANPVDLEFHQPWPRNLLVSFHLLNGKPPKQQSSPTQ